MATEMAAWETSAQHLETHFLTCELHRLGVTEEQRQATRFRETNKGVPFDSWAFTFPGTIPMQAFSLVRAYVALRWLILENPSPSRDRDDAWRLISETMAALTLAKARDAQSERAKKPRGKITDDGRTIGEVIAKLALTQYPTEPAKGLWTHLWAVLEAEGLNPEEVTDPKNPHGLAYVYDFRDRRKKITFRRFEGVVSKARIGKKSR